MFFHLALSRTISLMPVWNPLPNWSRHQSLSRNYCKPCSSHESVVTGQCTALFACLWYMYNIWSKHAARTAWSTWLVYLAQPLLNKTQNYVIMYVENVAVLVHLLTWLCLGLLVAHYYHFSVSKSPTRWYPSDWRCLLFTINKNCAITALCTVLQWVCIIKTLLK